jgi:uncharacterized membrane protein
MAKKKANTVNYDKRTAKKAAVLGNKPKSSAPKIILLTGIFLMAGAVYAFYNFTSNRPIAADMSSGVQMDTKTVTYPVGLFSDGKARHFQYKHSDDVTIRYFIVKSSDGIIRAAFDACDVCWPANKGYYQEGDFMVCRNCGRRFASVLVNEVKGGCNPAPLSRQLAGEELIIRIDDIVQGKQYFDFAGRG